MIKLSNLILCMALASSSQLAANAFTPHAFIVSTSSPNRQSSPSSSLSHCSTTALYGRKKGKLTQTVSPGGTKTKKKNNRKSSVRNDSQSSAAIISPSLAQWAASQSNNDNDATTTTSTTTSPSSTVNDVISEKDDSVVSTFTPFQSQVKSTTNSSNNNNNKKKKTNNSKSSTRRERQAQRQAVDAKHQAAISSTITSIREMLEEKSLQVDSLLSLLRNLLVLQSTYASTTTTTTLKSLLAQSNKEQKDYTLAWVGSDEAICHIGTGLHKVPLARLQEIFLTLGGPSANFGKRMGIWQIYEVIRILGPFPNVRNTLRGDVVSVNNAKSNKNNSNDNGDVISKSEMNIRYESMVDGTGKEILAGTEDNVRMVDIDVLYADDNAIICAVPSENNDNDDDDSDVWEDNGKNILLFLKEEDLEARLEILRVA